MEGMNPGTIFKRSICSMVRDDHNKLAQPKKSDNKSFPRLYSLVFAQDDGAPPAKSICFIRSSQLVTFGSKFPNNCLNPNFCSSFSGPSPPQNQLKIRISLGTESLTTDGRKPPGVRYFTPVMETLSSGPCPRTLSSKYSPHMAILIPLLPT